MPLPVVIIIAALVYISAIITYWIRAARIYDYVKQKYPGKLDIFDSTSPRGLLWGFWNTKLPGSAKSVFSWRYLIKLQKTVQADPDFSRDNVLLAQFSSLKKMLVLESIAIVVIVAALIELTLSLK